MSDILLSQLINTDAKDYAIYTVENRAIPNMIDGLKPVQRFVLYRAIQMCKGNTNFFKLASIAGGVADVGYHHGETSAQDAGALMANTWNNNYPILTGRGNFGSRLVQEAAASRYIYCKVDENFHNTYKDNNIAPKHKDIEHLPPAFYLPIIPTVLLNGITGIATGYKTTILPHSVKSVIECTKLAVLGKLDKEPEVSYPKFRGDVVSLGDGKYELHGKYELRGRGIYISEIPYSFDRATYIESVLDKLESDNLITYEDDCSKTGFGFKVRFRKDYKLHSNKDQMHQQIMKDFKLIQKVSQSIVVIDEEGKVKDDFNSASELIKHFVKVRSKFIDKRISINISDYKDKLIEISAKIYFIESVLDNKIIIKDKSRKQLVDELNNNHSEYIKEYAEDVISLQMYRLTTDEIDKLKKLQKDIENTLKYWESTTVEKEFLLDLEKLNDQT